MSKEAALRAMREARYNERAARSTPPAKPTRPVAQPTKAQPTDAVPTAPPGEALCGHRSMNGRTCTREQGHSAKSHRYS